MFFPCHKCVSTLPTISQDPYLLTHGLSLGNKWICSVFAISPIFGLISVIFILSFGEFFSFFATLNNNNTLFRMTNPETEDPEVIPITGPPT